jgi:signal transduction histidine kinase
MHKLSHQRPARFEAIETEDKQLIETLVDCKQLVDKIVQALLMGPASAMQPMISNAMKLHSEIEAIESLVADKRHVEHTLIESNEALQYFSRKTLQVLEEDRQRLAKQMHDVIGAGLSAIKFMIEEKQDQIESNQFTPDLTLKPVIQHLMNMIKEAKRIATQLRPSTLDDLGLLATLAAYCRKLGECHKGVEIVCKAEVSEEQIPEEYKILIYRLLQEAMTTASSQGPLTSIRSTLDIDGDHLRLIVEDDGNGTEKDSRDNGCRLQRMRAHAEICGGTFNIDYQTGYGTRINVRLPLPF